MKLSFPKSKIINGEEHIWCRLCKKYLPADQFYNVSGRRYADACKFHKKELSKKYYAKNKMRAKGAIKRRIRDVDEVDNVIVVEKREVSDEFVKKTIQAQNKLLIRR